MQPSLRRLGRRAFTRTEKRSGFNVLQAAVLEGDVGTVRKASAHLENFVEEMKYRNIGEKAPIFAGASAADIFSAFKDRRKSHSLIGKIYKEFVEIDVTLTALHSCARRNDVEMAIELVLNDGMDVNVAAKRNITPLLWASTVASSFSIKTLIDLGADVNSQTFQDSSFGVYGSTALDSAVHCNNVAVVNVLLANNADANIFDQKGNTVLHSSTSKRFFNISQLLIESGSEINVGNNNGETPLYCAVLGKNEADVKLLLKNSADPNIQERSGNTPLHRSTLEGFSDISRLLIDSGCKINGRNSDGETPLYSAVRGKNVADVELLLQKDADANIQDTSGNTPLHISTFMGFSDISQFLVDSGCKINRRSFIGGTPLHAAVHGKNVAEVELLLKNNADANMQDELENTPLHISTCKGFSKISQLLIESGCKINGRGFMGETPLHSAVRSKNVAVVKLLLKNDADGNVQDVFGNAPLHISAVKGFSTISQLLIKSGCKINVRGFMGETPLHCAVRSKNVADVKLLLKNNADGNIQDRSGNTPLHRSTLEGFSNISWLLMDSGCNENLKNRVEPFSLRFGGDFEEDKGNDGYESIKTLREKVVVESEDVPLMNTRTRSTLSLPIVAKRREQSSTEGSGDGGDFEEDKGTDGYESIKTLREKVVVESEDVPLKNTRTRSTLSLTIVAKGREQSSTEGSGDGSDFEEDKGNDGYESIKTLREKVVVESEDVPLMNTRTRSTLSLTIVAKRREQSSTEGSGDGGDFEQDKGNDGYESIKTLREKVVVENEDAPLTNTQTLSLMKEKEQSSAEGSGDGSDLEGHRGKNRHASLKSFQEKIVVESEDAPLTNTQTLSLMKENEQSSAEGSGDGSDLEGHRGKNRYASLKSFQGEIVVESEDAPLTNTQTLSLMKENEQSSAEGSGDGSDLVGHRGKNRYASLKSFQGEIVVESEDAPLTNTQTLSLMKENEQSSAEGSGDGSDLEGHRGKNRYASLKSFQEKIVVESKDAPLTNTQTLSLMKENEQSSAEGSGDGSDLEGHRGKNRYASLKSFQEKIVVGSKDAPLKNTQTLSLMKENEQSSAEGSGDGSDLEGHRGKNRYASLKSFQEKIVVESEDAPLTNTQTLSLMKENEQSLAEGSVDGSDLEGHRGKNRYASLKSFQEKIVVESEDSPLTNTRTLSLMKEKEQSSEEGSGDGSDLEGHRGKNRYASLKSFQEKIVVKSEDAPLTNTQTLSLMKEKEQSSAEGSGDGSDLEGHRGKNRYASLKSFQEKIVVGSKDARLTNTQTLSLMKENEQSSAEGSGDGSDLEGHRGKNRYASLKSFQEKIVVESEDAPLTNTQTLSLMKENEQSSAEGSGDGSDLVGHRGKDRYASLKSFQEKIVVESEDAPLTNTQTLSLMKENEQSSAEGSGDGSDLEGHRGKDRYASLKSFQEKIVVESEDAPLTNTQTLSLMKENEQSSEEGSGDGSDLEGRRGKNRHASLKSFQEKIVVESEEAPLTNTETLSTLSLPIFDEGKEQSSAEGSGDGSDLEGHKGKTRYASLKSFQEKIVVESEDAPLTNTQTLSLMKENEQSSAEGSGDGSDLEGHRGKNRHASLKSFQEKIVVESEDVPLTNTENLSTLSLPIFDEGKEQSLAEGSVDGSDLEGHKGKIGCASLKSFKEKIVVESEDVPLTNTETLSTVSLPIFDEGKEQSLAEGSVDGGDLEGHKGKNRYVSLKSFQEKIVVESEDVPLTNTKTLSTLSLPIFDEGKEQSSAEGSGMELSPSKKPKSKIRKAKRTTSRVEGGGINRSKCEVM